MSLKYAAKLFLILVSASLIVFFFLPEATLWTLAKMVALSIGVTIIFYLLFPSIRKITGIFPGEQITVLGDGIMPKRGTALTRAKTGDEIRIALEDGKKAVGIVESYEGLLFSPVVRVIYKEGFDDREVQQEGDI